MKLFVVIFSLATTVATSPKTRRIGPVVKSSGEIVGGRDALEDVAPYQVSLRLFGKHLCGGAIYTATKVLTAAHCFEDTPSAFITARAGNNSLTGSGLQLQVSRLIRHPTYDKFSILNDIAMIELIDSFEWTSHVQLIRISKTEPPVGGEVIVTG